MGRTLIVDANLALILMCSPQCSTLSDSSRKLDNGGSTWHDASIPPLPVELWEAILFEYIRATNRSPASLLRVCRQWRILILSSGRLWRKIDLGDLKSARRHLEFSQESTLDVSWLNRSCGPGMPQSEYRAWIWPYSSRFARLALAHTSRLIQIMLSNLASDLPCLIHLTLIGQEHTDNLRVPIQIHSRTPMLKTMSLMYVVHYLALPIV
jgi:hypothetical protein